MRFTFSVRSNSFGAAPAKARAGIAKGFAAAKDVLLEDMKRRTPVDTTALRNSETAESDERSLTLKAGGGEVDYAIYVHQGTRFVGPRPFMRDAIEQGASRIADDLAAGIRGELQ